jgi:hypothetical protein
MLSLTRRGHLREVAGTRGEAIELCEQARSVGEQILAWEDAPGLYLSNVMQCFGFLGQLYFHENRIDDAAKLSEELITVSGRVAAAAANNVVAQIEHAQNLMDVAVMRKASNDEDGARALCTEVCKLLELVEKEGDLPPEGVELLNAAQAAMSVGQN